MNLAVVTSIFGITEDKDRERNLVLFLNSMESQGVEVVVMRSHSTEPLWQKERLLNQGFFSLPSCYEYVAWVDADIIFDDPAWALKACELLKQYPLIQLYDKVQCLGPEGGIIGESLGHVCSRLMGEENWCHGFAFAARRSAIKDGLYDKCIVGGGDTCLMAEAFGDRGPVYDQMGPEMLRDYEPWARNFRRRVRPVHYLPGTIRHLYHGPMSMRAYKARYRILRESNFDPAVDLAVGDDGLWVLKREELRLPLTKYFSWRNQKKLF